MLYILLYNGFVFLLYGFDKRRAIQHQNRISERALLLSALSFGSLGALLGMYIWHHKTKKPLFVIVNSLLLIVHIGLYVLYHNQFGF